MDFEESTQGVVKGLYVLGALGLTIGTALQVMIYADGKNRDDELVANSMTGIIAAMFAPGMLSNIDSSLTSKRKVYRLSRLQATALRIALASMYLPLGLWSMFILQRVVHFTEVGGQTFSVDLKSDLQSTQNRVIAEQEATRTLAAWIWLFFGALLTLAATSFDWLFTSLTVGGRIIFVIAVILIGFLHERLLFGANQVRLIAFIVVVAVLSLFFSGR